jgi:ubiquinone/menaquinone biosynthesis C-methylase UbiE
VAQQYIELFGNTAQAHPDDLTAISRHLVRPGAVLDVGCGPGHLTAHLRSLATDAVGIDIVPEFVQHARSTHQDGRYVQGSLNALPTADRSVVGILAWYSLIHLRPDDLDDALVELRRTLVSAGTLVAGFFDGDQIAPFDHKVTTAYRWPMAEFTSRLRGAGFREIERWQRPADPGSGQRSHAAIAAVALR